MNIVFFAIVCGVLAFLAALAIQMRIMVALVLRRALGAWNNRYNDRALANQAVICASADPFDPVAIDDDMVAAVNYLQSEYPLPLGHLKLARRASLFASLGLLVAIACGRFIFGVV